MSNGPDGRLPVVPIGPEKLEFIWGISNLDSSWQSLGLVLSTVFAGGLVMLIAIYAVRQNTSRFHSILHSMSVATVVVSVGSMVLISMSWADKDALDVHATQVKAVEVQQWLQTNGYPRVTYQQGLDLVCEHHDGKSAACASSNFGVLLPGQKEEVVIRRDTDGNYMLVNADVATGVGK